MSRTNRLQPIPSFKCVLCLQKNMDYSILIASPIDMYRCSLCIHLREFVLRHLLTNTKFCTYSNPQSLPYKLPWKTTLWLAS